MKACLIIGPAYALEYKEIYPLLRDKIFQLGIWTASWGEIGCNWYTTLSVERPVEKKLVLTKTYNENNYPRFDNDPEIIESKSKDIPIDYDGLIAVPITFFKYYIYLPYDILELRRGLKLKGKEMFSRLIIRRKQK